MADLQKYRESQLEKARTADLLRILPKGRTTVLDIGARDGHFSRLLTGYFSSVTALDLNKPPIDFPGIVPVAGNVTQLDFPDNAFDCVFCTEVLEHIPEVEKACREIVRVARHEIVIGVPYRQDIRLGRATCAKCGKVSPPWGHVNSFTENRLLELFNGMHLVSKSFVGETRRVTNPVSMALMDFAGNPWGTYDEDLFCLSCGAVLQPPSAERALTSKICSAIAHRLNGLQEAFASPHGNWVHLLFSRQPRGD